jgi:hypothetical protein
MVFCFNENSVDSVAYSLTAAVTNIINLTTLFVKLYISSLVLQIYYVLY